MSGWTWGKVLRQAAEVFREEGAKSLWFKILGETVYRRVVVMERPLDEPVAEIAARLPVVVSLLRESEVDDYIEFRAGADPSELRRRLEDGQLCFVVRHEGRIVHSTWVATGRAWIDYLSREMRLLPDEVYVYEAFTAPAFRGQQISPARAVHLVRHFQEAGYRRLVALIVPENKQAFRAAQRTGYKPCGLMGYLRLGPWRRHFLRVARRGSPPGEPRAAPSAAYWQAIVRQLEDKPHYLDPFLGQLKRQAYLALIERWGGVPAVGRVLKTDLFEEALGPDAFLMDLSRGGATVMGMDLSPAIASRAQQRDTSQQAHYLAADVRYLPFKSEAFALVVSPSTLDHFTDPSDLGCSLRELARVLMPDGQLIITLDNRQNIFDPVLRLAIRLGVVPYYTGRSYSVGELRAELEAVGLRVRDTTAILHNPRLVATASVAMANRLGWPPLNSLVHRALIAAQRLERTRWRYRTGSFVAARAVRLPPGLDSGNTMR